MTLDERVAVSPEEAAALLGISPETVRRLMAAGRLPYAECGLKPGSKRRIAMSVLRRFVDPELDERVAS